MADLQEKYDDAMLDFSMGDYDAAIEQLQSILAEQPDHFDAQLAVGMSYYRKGEYPRAIEEGHKAERMAPKEQLVHTNLSLFYMKNGDKQKAEHHGLQAKIASWSDARPPEESEAGESSLDMSKPKPKNVQVGGKFPDMPWKKKPGDSGGDSSGSEPSGASS